MSNVIIDALTLDMSLDLVATVGNGNFNNMYKGCFYNLLTSILLWDTLTFAQNFHINNTFKKLDGDNLTKKLHCILTPLESPLFVELESHFSEKQYREARLRTDFTDYEINYILQRTNRYLDISSNSKLSYLPHPIRANLLIKNAQNNIHTRESLIKRLEEKIYDYSECSVVHSPTPLLIDYIRKEVGDAPREQLSYALQLRNNKDIVAFRKSLDKFERLYIPGSINNEKIGYYEIDAIANEVFKKYLPNKLSNKFSFGINTSFGLVNNVGITGFGINLNNISIPKITGNKKILDKKFIYKLLIFGLNERK